MRCRHYKGGIYTVIADEAKNSETGELYVVYANAIGDVWIRPREMFHGYTEDGRKRFDLIEYRDEVIKP